MMQNTIYRVFVTFILSIFTLLFSASQSASEVSTFLSINEKLGEKYTILANSPDSDLLIIDGKKSIVNEKLKNLVPEKYKTASDYFILSNMLYRADAAASYSFIKKADELLPNNPYILFEHAMHEHRAGNCKTALPIYEKASVLFADKQLPNLWSYITHCRLILGDYIGAINSWKNVDFRNNHTSVEKSMYEIFSNKDSESERERLIISVSSGSVDKVCELIEFDKNWEHNWWNVRENKKYLEHDINFLKSLAKENEKIDLATSLCVDAIALNNKEFRRFISEAGYWHTNYILPEDPATSYMLIREIKKREIATPLEVLEHYENQLIERHIADPKNRRTLDVIAFLYGATGNSEKLKKIDLHGWKNLKIQKYAESYIHSIPDTSPEYKQAVKEAAIDFPNSVDIQGANLHLHSQSKNKLEFLVKYVTAQFSNVKNHLLGPYSLNDYMTSLEYELSSPKNSFKVTNPEISAPLTKEN